jgi:hypothetical protein
VGHTNSQAVTGHIQQTLWVSKGADMTNEILGWIISFAILTAAVGIRAMYLAVQDKVNKNS